MAKCDCDFCVTYCSCCFGKLTWPIVIAWFHIVMYLTVILFNGFNLVQAFVEVFSLPEESVEMEENYQNSSHLSLEFMIVHSISIIILATVGLVISANLLRGAKDERAKKLKMWLVYTIMFCVLTVPYYVWRLTVSDNLNRWLIQLVITNAMEGYFLGVAYSLITEMTVENVDVVTFCDSSRFRGLQSRDSQITFVGDMANMKSFSEMRI